MADTEFEEFRQCFDKLPQHIKAPAPFYSLVPAVLDDDDSPTSSKSDGDCDDMDTQAPGSSGPSSLGLIANGGNAQQVCASSGAADDAYCSLEERPRSSASMHSPLPPGLQSLHHHGGGHMQQQQQHHHHHHHHHHHQYPQVVEVQRQHVSGPMPPPPHCWIPTVPSFASTSSSEGGPSLASELASLHSVNASGIPGHICSTLNLRREIDSSPDSERPYTDVDSGHSTAHSPVDGAKSLSPPFGSHTEMLEATHRGLHKFVPRHRDEIEVEIGDPIYVQKEADDLWCEGVNLRTGRAGIFPSAYAVDTDYSEFDPACEQVRRERYLLGYLGSVETLAHKGTAVVCQATRRVASAQSHACVLEVSDRGLRMVDRTKPMPDQPCIDYFYSLKNVSFCAFHPRDHRYLGFITKHPTLQRFACHVFRGNESTRPVAEAVGRAFQRFYQKFIETAYPIEDIYIE